MVKKENCMHLDQPGIYLAADGKVSPCCYFADFRKFDTIEEMFYNIDIEASLNHPDKICLKNCGT